MNAHQLTRIADDLAISLRRDRAPPDKNRGGDGIPWGQDQLSRKGSPRPDLRGSSIGHEQIRGRSRDVISHYESEAMKARLLKHAFLALIVVLMFIGFHFVNKWPH